MPHSQDTVSRHCIHPEQNPSFPPAPYFAASGSHQSVLKPFKQGTEVTKRTAAAAIGASRFTLNDFTYFSLSFQSSFHLSLTVLVRYRSPANIIALEGYYLPLCAAVPSNTTLRMRTVTGVSRDHDGAITLYGPLSQQRVIPQRYLQIRTSRPQFLRPRPRIFGLSCSRFTRRYWGNHCYFLFLRLIICLNSAGLLISAQLLNKQVV